MSLQTCATYYNDGFETRNAPRWWNDNSKIDFLGEKPAKPGIRVGKAPNDEGYVVECYSERSLYSIVWCPREGDVTAYLMGPALLFLSISSDEKRNDWLEKIHDILCEIHAWGTGVRKENR